ncbi:hypothetical protein N9L68_04615 [bacterium]|nr:hypothetical protein [bacterium]
MATWPAAENQQRTNINPEDNQNTGAGRAPQIFARQSGIIIIRIINMQYYYYHSDYQGRLQRFVAAGEKKGLAAGGESLQDNTHHDNNERHNRNQKYDHNIKQKKNNHDNNIHHNNKMNKIRIIII